MTPIDILPCKCCGVIPIPVRESKQTGVYRICCMTWDCRNKLIVAGIDYGHAVLKWNEFMMEGTEDG